MWPWGGVAKAYPIAALAPLEILNDHVGDLPVAITWCPLSGSAVIFSRQVGDHTLTFRFYPELHKRNLIIEDVETGSRWNQLERGGIAGELRDADLEMVASVQTTWAVWKELHPETQVMLPTWGERAYTYRPEGRAQADGLPEQSLVHVVVGVREVRVFPFPDLAAHGGALEESLDGQPIRVLYRPEGPTVTVEAVDGTLLAGITLYHRYVEDFFPEARYWRAAPDPVAS